MRTGTSTQWLGSIAVINDLACITRVRTNTSDKSAESAASAMDKVSGMKTIS